MPRSLFDTRVDQVFETSTRRSRRKRRRLGAGFLLGGESLEDRTLLATVTVHVFNNDFSANVKGQPIVDPTINVGDTIHWVWDEGLHSTTSVAGIAELWDSGVTSTVGHTFDHTFTKVGTFAYYCTIHGIDNGNGTASFMSGTITVKAAAPTLAINNVTVTEGNIGTVNANFTISLSAPSGRTVTVNYATANGTATATADYTAIAVTTLTFTPGQTTKTVTVAVKGDTLDEANETFVVNLSAPTNATIADNQGVGTIIDDDSTSLVVVNHVTVTLPKDRTHLVVRGLGGSVTSLIPLGMRLDAIDHLIEAGFGASGTRPNPNIVIGCLPAPGGPESSPSHRQASGRRILWT